MKNPPRRSYPDTCSWARRPAFASCWRSVAGPARLPQRSSLTCDFARERAAPEHHMKHSIRIRVARKPWKQKSFPPRWRRNHGFATGPSATKIRRPRPRCILCCRMLPMSFDPRKSASIFWGVLHILAHIRRLSNFLHDGHKTLQQVARNLKPSK